MISKGPFTTDTAVLARIERLERQNRRMKLTGVGLMGMLAVMFVGGFQGAPPPRRISADEIRCGTITADAFVVSNDKETIHLDKDGLTISAKGETVANRTTVADHETRIQIGLDWDWLQENALRPTPRVLVGRLGHDSANNVISRATLLSPEGCHSGEWHTNNPKHDGRTDKDLIDDLRRR